MGVAILNQDLDSSSLDESMGIVVFVLALLALIPELYLCRKFTNFVNRQNVAKELEIHD
jgi:hypothetical protein